MSAKHSYSEMQAKLDELLLQIQSDSVGIDEALKLHKQAEEIIEELEDHLKNAKNHIEHLKNQ